MGKWCDYFQCGRFSEFIGKDWPSRRRFAVLCCGEDLWLFPVWQDCGNNRQKWGNYFWAGERVGKSAS